MKLGHMIFLGGTLGLPLLVLRTTVTTIHPPLTGARVEVPTFEVDPMWPKPLPNRWILGSSVGVAVDSRDHVYVLNLKDSFNARTEVGASTTPPTGECCTPAPSVLEFAPDGALVGQWGGPGTGYDWPTTPSGITVDPDGNIWIAGSGATDGQILKFSRDGRFILQIGKPAAAPVAATPPVTPDTAYLGVGAGAAAGAARGAARGAAGTGRGGGRGGAGGRGAALPGNSKAMDGFGGALRVAIDPATREGFVADGSRNRRVAVFDLTTGAIKRYWGAYGAPPDDAVLPPYDPAATPARQFRSPSCVKIANDGTVYVCDRGNNRIQTFRKDGSFVKEQVIAPKTRGEGAVWDIAFSRDAQQKFIYVADGMNMKIRILDRVTLQELTAFGDGGRQPGQFYAVHSIATDSKGNVYTAETLEGKRLQKFNFKGLKNVTPKDLGVLWPGRGGQ